MGTAKLVHETVVVDQRGNETGLGSNEGSEEAPGGARGARGEQAREEDVAGALVGEGGRGEGEGKAMMGFGETVRVAEGVDDGGDVVVLVLGVCILGMVV